MSWRPDFTQHRADPRLAQYAGRVARLFREEEEVGVLLVRLDAQCIRTSGHLWWQKWSRPHDTLELWMHLDGGFTDAYVTADYLGQELHDWEAAALSSNPGPGALPVLLRFLHDSDGDVRWQVAVGVSELAANFSDDDPAVQGLRVLALDDDEDVRSKAELGLRQVRSRFAAG